MKRNRWPIFAVCGLLLAVGWYVRSRTHRPVELLHEGENAIASKQWNRVEGYAIRLEEAGEREAAALLRARMLGEQERFEAMLQVLSVIQPDSPFFPNAAKLAGSALFALDRQPEAELFLARALEDDPEQVDVQRMLAVITYDLGRLSESVEHLQVVAKLDPQDGKASRMAALIYKDLDQPQLAEPAYLEALGRNLPDAMRDDARIELAQVYLKQQKYDAVAKWIKELSPAASQSVRGAILEAELAIVNSPPEEAATKLDAWMKQFPKSPDLMRLRAKVHRNQGQNELAIAMLEATAKLDPGDHRVPYELVQLYEVTGQKEKAVQAKKRVDAIQADLTLMTDLSREAMEKPRDATVRRKIADVCHRLGKTELAERWIKAANDIEGR